MHVHHGLSPNADAWLVHCQSTCDALGVPLHAARVRVEEAGRGLEAAAREARYRVFAALDVDALALAHHRDDQAETLLLQLLRGASVRGLAAMPAARPLAGRVQLLRPLLELDRASLERYAHAHGLAWVEDESNLDPSLARNHLRHTVLPVLERDAPGMTRALAAAASQFAEWAELLDALADADAAGQGEEGSPAIAHLRDLPEPRARNLLRRFLEGEGVEVRRHALVEATRQLRDSGDNAQVRVDLGGFSVVRAGGRARVVAASVFAEVPPLRRPWQGESVVDVGAAGRLTLHATVGEGVVLTGGAVAIRHRQAGDRLRLRPGQARRPLKDWLREAGVPYWLRPWLPVVEVDGEIAWVAGLGASAEFAAREAQPGWLIEWASPW